MENGISCILIGLIGIVLYFVWTALGFYGFCFLAIIVGVAIILGNIKIND